MKRIVLFTILFLTLCLSGCGNIADSSKEESKTIETATAETKPSVETIDETEAAEVKYNILSFGGFDFPVPSYYKLDEEEKGTVSYTGEKNNFPVGSLSFTVQERYPKVADYKKQEYYDKLRDRTKDKNNVHEQIATIDGTEVFALSFQDGAYLTTIAIFFNPKVKEVVSMASICVYHKDTLEDGYTDIINMINGTKTNDEAIEEIEIKSNDIAETEDLTETESKAETEFESEAETHAAFEAESAAMPLQPTEEMTQALKKAKSYLQIMPFSKKGLKEQLEYDGFNEAASDYAVENIGADWNTEAKKKAESYIEIMGFSKKGLKEQLEFDGFSSEEAEYGINNITVDWNEQAAKKAESYINIMDFTNARLIEQLEFDGFTSEEAHYGAAAVGY